MLTCTDPVFISPILGAPSFSTSLASSPTQRKILTIEDLGGKNNTIGVRLWVHIKGTLCSMSQSHWCHTGVTLDTHLVPGVQDHDVIQGQVKLCESRR